MADYIATARTNYFKVTDEQKYQKLFKGLISDNQLFDFTKEENGVVFHAFGAYGWISYETGQDDGESNDGFDFFWKSCSKYYQMMKLLFTRKQDMKNCVM